MDLKIKDVAELLNVSETTIRRWLLDGKIPAYKLNRQYRFSRIEIENWMMKQKLGVSQAPDPLLPNQPPHQIYPASEEGSVRHGGMQQFSLYRAIHRGGVHVDVPGDTKEEVIKTTMEKIAPLLRLDAEVLSELLLDRESLSPTALNNGIAVPHSRECLQRIPFDLVSIVFPKNPIDYGSLDGKPVDILFFLFATQDKTHLHLLSKIAHLSSDQEALSRLSKHPQKAPLLEFIREWEGNLGVHCAE